MIIVAIILFIAAVLAITLQFLSAFFHSPIQASIRALIGLTTLLVATMGIPSIEGVINITLDWGRALSIDSKDINVTTGTPTVVYAFAWIGVTTLLSICLFRVPTNSRKQEG